MHWLLKWVIWVIAFIVWRALYLLLGSTTKFQMTRYLLFHHRILLFQVPYTQVCQLYLLIFRFRILLHSRNHISLSDFYRQGGYFVVWCLYGLCFHYGVLLFLWLFVGRYLWLLTWRFFSFWRRWLDLLLGSSPWWGRNIVNLRIFVSIWQHIEFWVISEFSFNSWLSWPSDDWV